MALDRLFHLMAEKNASDLFISVGSPVTIKINGVCVPVNQERLTPEQVIGLLAERLNNAHFRELEEQKELNLGLPEQGLGSFRLSAFIQRGSASAVIRFIPHDIPKLDDLTLPEMLKDLVLEKRGLVLVVGAAGSGKSTTIASMLDHRNELMSGHILTFEDPIEFLFRNKKSIVNQREIGHDAVTLEIAMKNAMRQAPDVLFIGEIRDRDTMGAALAYSMSGHLVVATLHATNSAQALNRVISLYTIQGGFGAPNKFPQVPQLTFLLAQLEQHEDAPLREFLVLTLDAMADNGLHDHIGGGFFRYTVDPSWKTPHFEKMLYDNAQLARLYFTAARVLGRDDYRRLAQRTLDFLLREMHTTDGAFIASLSAVDYRGVEGGYYLWSEKQLATALTADERAAWKMHAGVTGAPPFDHGWLPLRAVPGLPLICVLTFQLVKDMAVYEMTTAMNPANQMLEQAAAEEVRIKQLNGELAAIEAKKTDRERKHAELTEKKAKAKAELEEALKHNEATRQDAISLTDYHKKELSEVGARQATIIPQFDADAAQLTKAIADLRARREGEEGRATTWNAEEARIENAYKTKLAAYTNKKKAYEKDKA